MSVSIVVCAQLSYGIELVVPVVCFCCTVGSWLGIKYAQVVRYGVGISLIAALVCLGGAACLAVSFLLVGGFTSCVIQAPFIQGVLCGPGLNYTCFYDESSSNSNTLLAWNASLQCAPELSVGKSSQSKDYTCYCQSLFGYCYDNAGQVEDCHTLMHDIYIYSIVIFILAGVHFILPWSIIFLAHDIKSFLQEEQMNMYLDSHTTYIERQHRQLARYVSATDIRVYDELEGEEEDGEIGEDEVMYLKGDEEEQMVSFSNPMLGGQGMKDGVSGQPGEDGDGEGENNAEIVSTNLIAMPAKPKPIEVQPILKKTSSYSNGGSSHNSSHNSSMSSMSATGGYQPGGGPGYRTKSLTPEEIYQIQLQQYHEQQQAQQAQLQLQQQQQMMIYTSNGGGYSGYYGGGSAAQQQAMIMSPMMMQQQQQQQQGMQQQSPTPYYYDAQGQLIMIPSASANGKKKGGGKGKKKGTGKKANGGLSRKSSAASSEMNSSNYSLDSYNDDISSVADSSIADNTKSSSATSRLGGSLNFLGGWFTSSSYRASKQREEEIARQNQVKAQQQQQQAAKKANKKTSNSNNSQSSMKAGVDESSSQHGSQHGSEDNNNSNSSPSSLRKRVKFFDDSPIIPTTSTNSNQPSTSNKRMNNFFDMELGQGGSEHDDNNNGQGREGQEVADNNIELINQQPGSSDMVKKNSFAIDISKFTGLKSKRQEADQQQQQQQPTLMADKRANAGGDRESISVAGLSTNTKKKNLFRLVPSALKGNKKQQPANSSQQQPSRVNNVTAAAAGASGATADGGGLQLSQLQLPQSSQPVQSQSAQVQSSIQQASNRQQLQQQEAERSGTGTGPVINIAAANEALKAPQSFLNFITMDDENDEEGG